MGTDPLRHHRQHRQNLFGNSLAERAAERFADFMGTVRFVVISTLVILSWVIVNGAYGFFSHSFQQLEQGKPFDAAPWILLNLVFSAFAFYTGALVIIASKAQAKKDQAREEADAKHREELHGELKRLLELNTALTRETHQLSLAFQEHLQAT